GAIGNGVELLALSNAAPTEEMALISQSVANANAKVDLFRIAFGTARSAQSVGATEMTDLLAAYFADTRTRCDWLVTDPVPRPEAKAALLGALCLHSALPSGGSIELRRIGTNWGLSAQGAVRVDAGLWAALDHGQPTLDLSAATVHFALLPLALDDLGRTACLSQTAERVLLEF
ncbi:MAG: histidine phosphotransferase, partial [Alphaproteobacteria bacterium]|nr:histidine phosphotransferase [Alphaproteobacteria bacterium]